jgi:quinol monooxygenase YgiN
MTLVLIAELSAKPGNTQKVLDLLNSMIEPSMAEDGCLGYRPLVDPAGDGRVLVLEEWADEDALQFHFATPYFQAAAAQLAELLSEPFQLRRLSPVDLS